MTTTTTTSTAVPARDLEKKFRIFSGLAGLTTLSILVQGLLAGLFLQGDDRSKHENYIELHGHGSLVAIILSLITAVYAVVALRKARKDLAVGAVALLVLVFVESAIGDQVGEKEKLALVHVPLAMAITGVAVWLVVKAVAARRAAAGQQA